MANLHSISMDFPKATTNITNTTTNEGALSPLTTGMVLELVAIAGSLANLLVIAAIALCKNWIITDVLLLSLSTADFLDTFIALHMVIFLKYFKIASWSRISCDAFVALLYTFRMASATTVTIIAVERAYILVFPLKHHTMVTLKKIKRSVIIVWIFAFVCSILPFIGVGHSGFQNHECYFQLYELGESYTIFIEVVGLCMLALVLSCYIAVKNAGRKFIKRQSTFTPSTKFQVIQPEQTLTATRAAGTPRHEKPKGTVGAARRVAASRGVGRPERRDSRGVQSVRKVSTMMGVVVLFYYISWLPFLLSNLASLITGQNPKSSVTLLTGLISFMHALVNPVLYGKMSPRYRKAYAFAIRRLLALCGGKAPIRLNSTRGLSRLNSAGDLNVSQTCHTELATSRSSIPNASTTAAPPTDKINHQLQQPILLSSNVNNLAICQEGEEELFKKEGRVKESNRLEHFQSPIINTSVGTDSLGSNNEQMCGEFSHKLSCNTTTDIKNKPVYTGDVIMPDRQSDDVTVPDRPTGDVTVSDRTTGNVTVSDRPTGDVTVPYRPSDDVTVSDRPSDVITVPDRPTGDVTALDRPNGDGNVPDRPTGEALPSEELQSSGESAGGESNRNSRSRWILWNKNELARILLDQKDGEEVFVENKYLCPDSYQLMGLAETFIMDTSDSVKSRSSVQKCTYTSYDVVSVPIDIDKFASRLTFEILKDLSINTKTGI